MFLSEWREFPSAPWLAGKKKTWWQLASRCCWNRARPWHASELVSLPGRAKDLPAPWETDSRLWSDSISTRRSVSDRGMTQLPHHCFETCTVPTCIFFERLLTIVWELRNVCLVFSVRMYWALSRIHLRGVMHKNINLLTPNVNYSGRTALLTSKVAFYVFIQQI